MPPPLKNDSATQEGQPEYPENGIDLESPNTSYNKVTSPNTPPNTTGLTRSRPTWKPGGDYLAGLRALTEVRPMPVKEGKELPPAKSTESIRPSTKGAYLLATRGIVRNPPCNHCATGAGRFSLCVSLDNWFHGACATCQMATRGHLCSLRIELDESLPSLKRKRGSSGGAEGTANRSYQNPYPTEPAPTGNQSRQSLPSHSYPIAAASSVKAGGIVDNDASPLLAYVYQQQNPANGNKRHHMLSRAERNSLEPASGSFDQYNGKHAEGMAAYGSDSMSNDVSYLRPQQAGNSATSVFDNLPKRNQKQIYRIIGGLQSGIRSVRQQTESLQKQLDLLQAALGIDEDDELDESII